MTNLLSMDDQFISSIHLIVEKNLDNENFTVEDLAKNAGLSRSMLHRKLIKLIGKSATDLITEKRLNRARELLEKDVGTASEIAYQVGFSSPSYFNKVFKKFYNVSPGDVRKGIAIALKSNTSKQPRGIREIYRKNISMVIILLIIIIALAAIGTGLYYKFGKNIPVEKSIAILPFDNLSTYQENSYFADGIVEDLLNRLSTISDLKVISRTSSEMFRDKGSKTISEIAEILGVSYILEGTVQREADKVRITIQLIDAKKDDHILSKQYDRDLSEVFTIQSEIASQITEELSLYLSKSQLTKLQKSNTENLKAFNYYQIGREYLSRRSEEEFYLSIDYFNKAIDEDSTYALAYAGLADAYYLLTWHKFLDDSTGRKTTVKLALKALEIDSNLAEAHTVLGGIYQAMDHNMVAAEKEYQIAIQKNRSYSVAYHYYAELMCITGHLTKAREFINESIELDPLSFAPRNISSLLYLKDRNYSKALEENQICLKLVPDHPWILDRNFIVYLGLDDEKSAVESFKKAGEVIGYYSVEQADSAYRSSGIEGLLRLRIKKYDWLDKAQSYILLREYEKAIDMLEFALNEGRLRPLSFSFIDSRNLKLNPRYKVIKKKLGLENY